MPKLSKIQRPDITENVAIDFGDGEVLNLVVYPNKVTTQRQREMESLDEDDHEGFAALFFEILKEWDLTDDAGEPLPFTAETIEAISVPTMLKISAGIGESLRPKSKSSRRSSRR